jgi:hypothetical protein
MPTLVHLADEKNANRILNAGIKTGKYVHGVHCMPVLPNFYVTHQWLRELKQSGAKTFVGVYFRIASNQLVYAGKYGGKHKRISLGEAIKEIMELEDPLGYELIVDRKIEPDEITKIKHLPQTIGWRYRPFSNGKKPCNCEYCLRGTIKGKRTKNRLDAQSDE